MMDIVVCPDNNYVMPCGILICSICENKNDEEICFHVIVDRSFLESNKASLKKIVQSYKSEIIFYEIDAEEIQSYLPVNKAYQSKYITIASYYRLLLGKILPANIRKVIYLDCDIIVCHSLIDLWNTNIDNYAIGCITDIFDGRIDNYIRLRYHPSLGYFNAGVLLINLEFWRAHNSFQQFIDFASSYPERLKYHDQDILNYIFRESKFQLPLKYNVQNGFLMKVLNFYFWDYESEFADALKNPYVIHYTSSEKPWIEPCPHPWKDKFLFYKKRTEWKDMPLQRHKNKTTWKTLVVMLLRKMRLMSKVQVINEYRDEFRR